MTVSPVPPPTHEAGDFPWGRIGAAVVIGGQSMALGLGISTTPPDGSGYWVAHGLLMASAAAVLVLLGRPLVENTLESVRDRELTVEMLFVASVLGALVASLASTFGRGSTGVYYDVVAVVLVIYTLGNQLRQRSRAAAKAALAGTRATFDRVWVEGRGGGLEERPAAGVSPGDRVVVPPGEPVGVDAEVESGTASVVEASITGEPLPVVKRPGDRLWAGSHVVDARLAARATAGPGSRRLDGILAAVEAARDEPTGFQRRADRVISWFLPVVLTVSAGTFAAWWAVTGVGTGVLNAMAVLLVACPCALGMATPVAVWRGVAALAGRGVYAAGASLIDGLSRVDAVVFDKTGTLTEAQPRVVDFVVAPEWAARRGELRAVVGAIESGERQPLAAALAAWGRDGAEEAPVPVRVASVEVIPGQGRRATVERDGRLVDVVVGAGPAVDGAAMEEAWRAIEADLRAPDAARRIRVAAGGGAAAVIAVAEAPRPEVAALFAELRGLGLTVEVMTGDPTAPAEWEGAPVRRGLSPAAKAAAVEGLRAEGRQVLVVGDGLNDAAAMAGATASLAIADGASLTRAAAQGVVASGDLRVIAAAVRTARSVRRGIEGNLVFAAVYNLAGVGVAAAGWLHPVVAALLMLVSSVVVAARAVRSAA